MNVETQYRVEQLLFRNAELCDAQDWDAYLDMFSEDSEFHLPQWESEHVYTTDPKTGMSLIYYANRGGLEDRVYRLRTGKASSAIPMPRTLHQLNNIRVSPLDDADTLAVKVNWNTWYYRLGIAGNFFGRATYHLRPAGESWRIARKHVLLLNDTIDSVLDFYHL